MVGECRDKFRGNFVGSEDFGDGFNGGDGIRDDFFLCFFQCRIV